MSHDKINDSLIGDQVSEVFRQMLGQVEIPDYGGKLILPRKTIYHYNVEVIRIEKKARSGAKDISFRLAEPKIMKTDTMPDGIEYRYCKGAEISDIGKVASFQLTGKHLNELKQWFDLDSVLKTFIIKHGYDLYGGTGLNANRFYGVQWPSHPFKKVGEAIGSVSLYFTPLAEGKDKLPLNFDNEVLVVSDEEFETYGLIPGNGAFISRDNINGQARALFVETYSMSKGMRYWYKHLLAAGVKVPDKIKYYDCIMSESDIKTNKLGPGVYKVSMGITYNNTYTIRGQQIAAGFEFWQFIKYDEEVAAMAANLMAGQFINYDDVILNREQRRKLAAHIKGEKYEPLEVSFKKLAAYLMFNIKYPSIADWVKHEILYYLVNQSFPGTEMRHALVVKDWVVNGMRNTEDGNCILFKYPITAGVVKAKRTCEGLPFLVISETTGNEYNIDSDGDIMAALSGPIADMIIQKDLIKPLRDISLEGITKREDPLNIDSTSITMAKILKHQMLTGVLSLAYYRTDIANERYGYDFDLLVYPESIEAVLKNVKHNTNLTKAYNRDMDTETLLRDLIPMPWREVEYSPDIDEVKSSKMDIKEFCEKHRTEPIHYMDIIWNAVLDRASMEADKIEAQKQPLSTFGLPPYMGPIVLPDDDDMDLQIMEGKKTLETLNKLWGELRPDGKLAGRAGDLSRMISAVTSGIPTESKILFLRQYFAKTEYNDKRKRTGSFVYHIHNFWEAFKTGYVKMDFIGKSKKKVKVVRLWNSDVAIDYDMTANIKIQEGMAVMNDSIFCFGDEYTEFDLSSYDLEFLPYVSGGTTKSVWCIAKEKAA